GRVWVAGSGASALVCPWAKSSSDIEVPSSVVNETLPSGFKINSSFFSSFFSSFLSSCCWALALGRNIPAASAANMESPRNAQSSKEYGRVVSGVRDIQFLLLGTVDLFTWGRR